MQTKILIFFLASLISLDLLAEEKKHSIYAGVSRPNFKFEVRDLNSNLETQMVRHENLYFTLGYSRLPRPLYFNWLRWSLEFSISPYTANRQIANRISDQSTGDSSGLGNEVDLGTKITGTNLFINPTIDLYFPYNDNYYFYFGFGIGLGYASVNGDYYHLDSNASTLCLQSTTTAQVKSNCSKNNVNLKKFALSSNVVMVLNLSDFGIRYERGGPEIEKNNKKYTVHNEAISLIYQYRF